MNTCPQPKYEAYMKDYYYYDILSRMRYESMKNGYMIANTTSFFKGDLELNLTDEVSKEETEFDHS
jgi:hypothetical protein